MSTDIIKYTVPEIERIGQVIAKSGLFGVKTMEQAMALCLIAQAEGVHPALAAINYNVIQGKPSKTAEAMQRSFMEAGGKIEWHELTDAVAEATFSHQQGGMVKIKWDMKRAEMAGLAGKDLWKKYPRQMLRARCISEGIKTIWPGASAGMYTPEEVRDFTAPMKGSSKSAAEVLGDDDIPDVIQTTATEVTEVEKPAERDLKKEMYDTVLGVMDVTTDEKATPDTIVADLLQNKKVKWADISSAGTPEQMKRLTDAIARGKKMIEEFKAAKSNGAQA